MDSGSATTPTIRPATMFRGHWLRASSPFRAASINAIIRSGQPVRQAAAEDCRTGSRADHPRLHDQPHAERAAVLLTDRVGLMLNPTMRASPRVMTAMRLHADGVPLALDSVPMPVPGSGQ